ncbi:transcriptional regulator [Cytobacillus phage Bfsp1]|nr:transcriptional regulator [Cytobacillus phage Bfsp1]
MDVSIHKTKQKRMDVKMRKFMTKEVTITEVKIAKISMDSNGMPVAEQMEPMSLLGNVSKEKAQKLVTAEHGMGVTVFGVQTITQTYKMKVKDFIKVAELVSEGDNLDEEESEEDSE